MIKKVERIPGTVTVVYECGECGDQYDNRAEAAACCTCYRCTECGEEYDTKEEAAECYDADLQALHDDLYGDEEQVDDE